jgi:hypothetical protein
MTEITDEDELLRLDVSDETLEAAASEEQTHFTLGSCTGLSVCPG